MYICGVVCGVNRDIKEIFLEGTFWEILEQIYMVHKQFDWSGHIRGKKSRKFGSILKVLHKSQAQPGLVFLLFSFAVASLDIR